MSDCRHFPMTLPATVRAPFCLYSVPAFHQYRSECRPSRCRCGGVNSFFPIFRIERGVANDHGFLCGRFSLRLFLLCSSFLRSLCFGRSSLFTAGAAVFPRIRPAAQASGTESAEAKSFFSCFLVPFVICDIQPNARQFTVLITKRCQSAALYSHSADGRFTSSGVPCSTMSP